MIELKKTKLNLMNPIKLYLLISILLILPSCKIQSADTARAVLSDGIPEGAVPFEYEYKLKKFILIPGTLNDSIPLKYWLETGFGRIAFSDSLASDFESKEFKNGFSKVQKTMKVRIGGLERAYGDSVDANYFDKNNLALRFTGAVGIIPWQFFDKKIIEISFSKQYIRELSSTKNLSGYDSVKIEIQNGLLGIPVAISVQGKKIREFVMIDTGCNGNINFSNSIASKYGIKSDSAFIQKSHLFDGIQKDFAFRSDTIQVGKYFVTEKEYVSFSQDKHRPYPFSGLIGTGTLEKFDVVLDLKNYYLYLKPIKK
jgi:hypothetical protein